MRNVQGNLWIPDEGYKHITNGEVFTDSIYLGAKDSIGNWHDTNDEPPEPEDNLMLVELRLQEFRLTDLKALLPEISAQEEL